MIISMMNDEDLIGRRVKIRNTNTKAYSTQGLVGKCGTIKMVSDCSNHSRGSIGVDVDGKSNMASSYGIYWFYRNELDFLNKESEDIIMEGYKNVAIVNLLEDYSKKDYGFALYDEDFKNIVLLGEKDPHVMVVVNARGKNNRILGIIKEIMSVESYKGAKPTAEVVGVVDMNGYVAREAEKVRLEEIAKKRAIIEVELEKEINKRKYIEYYEEMAKQYADNPRLAELVGELRGLGA